MKNKKGITLIALVITIIVMMILVGVSVSIVINTGLFKTASGTSKNMEEYKMEELDRSIREKARQNHLMDHNISDDGFYYRENKSQQVLVLKKTRK